MLLLEVVHLILQIENVRISEQCATLWIDHSNGDHDGFNVCKRVYRRVTCVNIIERRIVKFSAFKKVIVLESKYIRSNGFVVAFRIRGISADHWPVIG